MPVAAGKGLEYKLTMKKGEGLVYNISYGALSDPKLMVMEFHGHTKQVDGVGDLMFYRRPAVLPRAASSPRRGTASTAGISRTTARRTSSSILELAGFYTRRRSSLAPSFEADVSRQPLNRSARVEMLEEVAFVRLIPPDLRRRQRTEVQAIDVR